MDQSSREPLLQRGASGLGPPRMKFDTAGCPSEFCSDAIQCEPSDASQASMLARRVLAGASDPQPLHVSRKSLGAAAPPPECVKCGSEFKDDAIFCRICGSPREASLDLTPYRKEFQARAGNSGTIAVADLSPALAACGFHCTDDEVNHIIDNNDFNKDSHINLDEFMHCIKGLVEARDGLTVPEFVLQDVSSADDSKVFTSLNISLAICVTYFALGFLYGHVLQGWSFTDSVYFVVVTLTTVGYGDFDFDMGHDDWKDRVFGGAFVFVGVVFVGAAAVTIVGKLAEVAMARKVKEQAAPPPGGFVLRVEVGKVYNQLYKCIFKILLALGFGTGAMMWLEHWTFPDAFYWASITMTTVGYGDLTPTTTWSKWFSIIFIFVAFSIIADSMGVLAAIPSDLKRLQMRDHVLHQFGENLDGDELEALMDNDLLGQLRTPEVTKQRESDPYVNRAEFALWMLLKQGNIEMEDCTNCFSVFDELDPDRSGRLNQEDIDFKMQQDKTQSAVRRLVRRASCSSQGSARRRLSTMK